MAVDEFHGEDSKWAKIQSIPGIYVSCNMVNGLAEVIIDRSYMQCLREHNLRFLVKSEFESMFGYDPTKPQDKEVDMYGIEQVSRAYYICFLYDALEAIWYRESEGLELYLRSTAPWFLEVALEWAILNRDILVRKDSWLWRNTNVC